MHKEKYSTEADIDRELRLLFDRELPKANENRWFTARVMNRLPAQSRWAKLSAWQWAFYILGFIGFVVACCVSGRWLIEIEFSLSTLVAVASISMLATVCAAVMMVPSLVKILREP